MSFGIPDIDNLAPANCHYCIVKEGTIGGDYKGYRGETFPLPNNADAGNVEKCDGQRLDIGKYDALFDLIEFKFGGDYNAGFNLPDLSSTPPTKAYGYRITLDGLSREALQASYYCSRQTIPLWASTFAMGSCCRFSKTQICSTC